MKHSMGFPIETLLELSDLAVRNLDEVSLPNEPRNPKEIIPISGVYPKKRWTPLIFLFSEVL